MSRKLPSLRWAAGGGFVAGILSRLAGLVRAALIASCFGAGADLDAVYLGLSVPIALSVGIGGGLSRALIPVAATLPGSKAAALWRDASRRLARFVGPLSLVMALTAPLWCLALTWGEDSLPQSRVALAAVLGALGLLGGAIGGLADGLVHARGRHVTAALKPLFYNFIVIGVIWATWRQLGALSVALSVFTAEWLQTLMLWPALPRGGPATKADLKPLWAAFRPAAAIVTLMGVNVAVDRVFAARLSPGAISSLTYADYLVNLPAGLLGSSLAAPLFKRLAHYRAAGRTRDFDRTLTTGVRVLLLAGAPLAAGLAVLAEPAIGILLQRNAFDSAAVSLSAQAIRGYAPGIPFLATLPLLIAAGLAAGKPWRVAGILAFGCAVNAAADWWLVQVAGVAGIATATSIVALVVTAFLVAFIAPRVVVARDLWLSALTAGLHAGGIALSVGAIRLIPHAVTSEAWGVRLAVLATGAVMAGAVTALLWRPLLRREWASLQSARREAARAAEADGSAGRAKSARMTDHSAGKH